MHFFNMVISFIMGIGKLSASTGQVAVLPLDAFTGFQAASIIHGRLPCSFAASIFLWGVQEG
jgi:hypothetical protein